MTEYCAVLCTVWGVGVGCGKRESIKTSKQCYWLPHIRYAFAKVGSLNSELWCLSITHHQLLCHNCVSKHGATEGLLQALGGWVT
jgi:hypothetical protein